MHTVRCGIPSGQLCHAIGSRKETKLEKCLCIERQGMWDIQCVIVQAIFGGTGMVIKDVKKNVESLPGNYSVGSL